MQTVCASASTEHNMHRVHPCVRPWSARSSYLARSWLPPCGAHASSSASWSPPLPPLPPPPPPPPEAMGADERLAAACASASSVSSALYANCRPIPPDSSFPARGQAETRRKRCQGITGTPSTPGDLAAGAAAVERKLTSEVGDVLADRPVAAHAVAEHRVRRIAALCIREARVPSLSLYLYL
jgi:hypothetical protein